MRAPRIDLSNTLLLTPTYAAAAQLIQPDVFRLRGVFGLRPSPIAFDFVFLREQGTWRLYGISIEPQPIATVQPAPVQVGPKPAAPRRHQARACKKRRSNFAPPRRRGPHEIAKPR